MLKYRTLENMSLCFSWKIINVPRQNIRTLLSRTRGQRSWCIVLWADAVIVAKLCIKFQNSNQHEKGEQNGLASTPSYLDYGLCDKTKIETCPWAPCGNTVPMASLFVGSHDLWDKGMESSWVPLPPLSLHIIGHSFMETRLSRHALFPREYRIDRNMIVLITGQVTHFRHTPFCLHAFRCFKNSRRRNSLVEVEEFFGHKTEIPADLSIAILANWLVGMISHCDQIV